MEFEPKPNSQSSEEELEFAEPLPRKPLEILRDTEAFIRRPIVGAIVPMISTQLSENDTSEDSFKATFRNKLRNNLRNNLAQGIESASSVAEETLAGFAEIDIDNISDWELRPARMRIGFSFVGFSGLMIIVLLLYLTTLHPELSPTEQIGKFWNQYVWFVCLGIAGMFILGREAMRPVSKPKANKSRITKSRIAKSRITQSRK
ncbi:MAG: hypothetical protein ACFB02_14100 [Mastigocoleus sp.]